MGKRKFHESVALALRGLIYVIKNERNLTIDFIALLIAVTMSIILKISKIEFIIILSVSFAVVILEAMNTAIEKLINYLEPRKHPEIKLVKDIMAGAVLLVCILSIILGALILVPALYNTLI